MTYFNTEPATLVAERGDQSVIMIQGSNGVYQGRNEHITKTDSGLEVVWGYDAPVMQCREKSK